MNRPGVVILLCGGIFAGSGSAVQAQERSDATRPQVYGTSWGVASYGLKRTTSSYASPRGVGYGYGTPPLGFVPGKFGVELWRPNEVVAPGVYGVAHQYRTFPYPYPPGPPAYGPSIGEYAPGFGPELRSPSIP